ncbi:MAG TPA: hypothetical protein VLJ16_09435 [Acidobacteriota bacterium]|nr:hypothetical protein [Acidobacteriota bacterium]
MNGRARSAAVVMMAGLLIPGLRLAAQTPSSSFYQRGTVYLDWNGSRYSDGTMFNQVSVRLKFDLIDQPGQGWTLTVDARDRVGFRSQTDNQVILYNARLAYDKPGSRFTLALGQMNLYETAGIGALLGGMAGFKPSRDILIGAFGGIESTPYISRLDTRYLKAGAFVRWLGAQGRTIGLTFNHLRYNGDVERQFAYANVFLPFRKVLVIYGDAEYELGGHVAAADRLSRLFGNVRLDLGRYVDLTASYSSGRGLDFHRYLLEASQDPTLFGQDIERFYYTSYYGARLSLKPVRTVRLSVSRQESRQKDLGISNHTWRFGASAWNIFGQGLSVVADYALNRGDLAESDTYYASLAKDFGRFSLNGSFSNSFNGLRIDPGSGDPLIVHLADHRNVSLGALVRLGRGLSASLEYGGFLQSGLNEHFLFFRLIYRSY